VGAWIGASFGRLRQGWPTLTALFVFGLFAMAASVLLVYGLGILFIVMLQGWERLGRILADPAKLRDVLEAVGGAFTLLSLLAGFIVLRLYGWILLAAVHVSSDPALGFRAALRKGQGRGYAFLALLLLHQLALNVGMILLLIPGLVMAVLFSFALWCFAREGRGVFQSLGDSARAVKGHFLGILGRMLLAGLIGGSMMLVPVAGWIAGAAWIMLAWGALYDDLRTPSPAVDPLRRPGVARPAPPRVGTAPLRASR
jgi:hypothetical protein